MRTKKLAVVGYGVLGRACMRAIQADEQSVLAGVVRQADHLALKSARELRDVPVVGHISELGHVDAALICVPTEAVLGVLRGLLQHGTPAVECATLHEEAFRRHKEEIDQICRRYKVPAVVGAGWDPGALSVFRSLFALLTPKGHTEIDRRPGVSLHHTTLAQSVSGVKAALATEARGVDGRRQHYVYVELEKGADPEVVEAAILADPLFVDEQSFVFVVDSIAALEEEGHGIVVQRHGATGAVEHQMLLLEGRFSETAMAAQVMLCAARTLETRGDRAYSLFDLPLGRLWGELGAVAESAWM